MSPLEIAFGIAVIGGLAYYVAKRKKQSEQVDAPVAAYKVEAPVVEEAKPEVAPAPVAVEAPVAAITAKKPRAKKAPAEKPAATAKQPAKAKTTKAKATKAVVKKAKIRVVK